MNPVVINLDSAFDWTNDVRQLWEEVDWEKIRRSTAVQADPDQWMNRRDELSLIGLVSSLAIDEAYRIPHWEEGQGDSDDAADNMLSGDWRERQLRVGREENSNQGNLRRRTKRFNGEEPSFRSPHVGYAGVVECYGIYVDNAQEFLARIGLVDKASLASGSAIFLCPERIVELYSTLMSIADLRHPLALSTNPVLMSLRMTLLHELGHHFFPIHRSGAGRFLCEGLANRFCHEGVEEAQQAWLLYKTWYLQPPEYSAYRPLGVLCEADSDCRFAAGICSHGDVNGWNDLPTKKSHEIEHNIGASLNMALAVDAAACNGLGSELRKLVSEENRWFLNWDGNHLLHHFRRHDQGHIPGDFVLDLYRKNDLASWATRPELPSHIWGRWAYGDEVRWPHNCIDITEADADKWFAYYARAEDVPIASVICERLVNIVKANPNIIHDLRLKPALDRAITVASNDQAMWFDRVPAIQLLEACSEVAAIPTLEAIAATNDWGDVHEAAANAFTSLRADGSVGVSG